MLRARSARSALSSLALAACVWLLAVPARAQIDDAMRLVEDADFAGAIAAFDRAEAGTTLDRGSLLRLFAGRAMAAWATGDEASARRDLAALASIEPGYALPPEAPPDLADAFTEARRATPEPLAIDARWETRDGATTLTATVTHDAQHLVRATRAHVRVGTGAWRIESLPLVVHLAAGERAEAFVEAIGPGDAAIAHAGSEDAPITETTIPVAALEGSPPPSDATPIWIGLGVGAGVAVLVAAIVIGVVIGGGGSNDSTQPRLPVVVGF